VVSTNISYGKKYGYCEGQSGESGPDTKNCALLNKRLKNDNTVHWGKMCNIGTDKVPLKTLCEEQSGSWVMNNSNKWSCINNKRTGIISDPSLCGDKGTIDSEPKCIVEVPDTVSIKGVRDICEKWSANMNPEFTSIARFKYSESKNDDSQWSCILGAANTFRPPPGSVDSVECKQNNNVHKSKYIYTPGQQCPTTNNKILDVPMEWHGGNFQSGGDYQGSTSWTNACSSSISSSCRVTCDSGYGGGGDFICGYNDDSTKICNSINEAHTDPLDKKSVCDRYVSCDYNEISNECTPNVTEDYGGQMEWSGAACYPLNNDAFTHGTYNYPLLDKVYPPFMRFITFFLLILIIVLILYKVGVIKLFSKGVMVVGEEAVYETGEGLVNLVLHTGAGVTSYTKELEQVNWNAKGLSEAVSGMGEGLLKLFLGGFILPSLMISIWATIEYRYRDDGDTMGGIDDFFVGVASNFFLYWYILTSQYDKFNDKTDDEIDKVKDDLIDATTGD